MGNHKFITPEGTKDYIFDEVTARNSITKSLATLFSSNSYSEVVTPSLEYLDVFLGKGHGIPIEYMYKLVDHNGRLMVLRPDSTTPIARLCATRLKDEKMPIRLFYNQSVYSTTRQMSGKSNEVLQSGVELIGKSNEKSDLEVLTLAIRSLEQLKPLKFRVELGHIGIFNTLIDSLNIDDETKEQIRICIESKNYPSLNDMLDKIGDSYEISVLKQLPRLFGDEEVFDKALAIINDEKTIEIINYLKVLYQKLKKIDTDGEITVDFSVVNRTDYYTGVVFKGYIEGCFGEAVLSGGRYDNLMSGFFKESGAIGFALNVDVAAKALINERGQASKPDIIVFCDKDYEIESFIYIKTISDKYIVEFSILESLEETIEYAKTKGIKRIDIVNDSIKTIEV